MSKPHRGGHNAKSLAAHLRDGTYRPDRHSHLLAVGDSGGVLAAFLAEHDGDRNVAAEMLRFFGPPAQYRTPAAIAELEKAFGLDLSHWESGR